MRKRLVQILGLVLCMQCCYMSASVPKVIAKEPIRIIDTNRIVPNIRILLDEEIRVTQNWNDVGEDTTLQISYPDAQLLLKVASAEASTQGVEGMKHVMEVILNRVRDDDFPDTIQGVVYQKGAFETVTKGVINIIDIPAEAHLALADIEKNKDLNIEIVAFETKKNGRKLEKHFKYSFTLKDHDFYTKKN